MKKVSGTNRVEEPEASYTSRIRAIGNSKGVILNSRLIETAGLRSDQDIIIRAKGGVITILAAKKGINTDLSTWDKQFKSAMKNGAKPEKDMFEGMQNKFDLKEW